jgi:hypothetical protein
MNEELSSKSKISSKSADTALYRNAKKNYNQQLKENLHRMIDHLQLDESQKDYLRLRWLDQLLWMEGRANWNRNWYRRLRICSIIFGVIVPVLVTLDSSDLKLGGFTFKGNLKGATIVLSSVIAMSAALEEFFQFGDRWYSYRKSSELLKTNGWQFMQCSGQYRSYSNHKVAFPIFTEQVEAIVQRDVEIFTTEGLKNKLEQEEKEQTPQSS